MSGLLVENTILEIGLREGCIHLVDLLDLNVLGNDAVPIQQCFALHSGLLGAWANVLTGYFFIFVLALVHVAAIFIHDILINSVRLLMDQTEADIVFKLRDGEVQFILLAQILKQQFSKRTDDRFFVVVDHILEKLIDELDFEVGQIEPGVVVAVEGVGEVQHNFIALVLIRRVEELQDPPIAEQLDLLVTRHQAVEFELLQVGRVQVRYSFSIVFNYHALHFGQ